MLPPDDRHRVELVGAADEPPAGRLPRIPSAASIGHPFNPPHLIPLVEVVGGDQTAPGGDRARAGLLHRDRQARRSTSAARCRAMSPTACRRRCGARRCIWSPSGVASVADVDTAISDGPGLRWALMGPHLTFHLAGGIGGIAHFLDQFVGADGRLVGRSRAARPDPGAARAPSPPASPTRPPAATSPRSRPPATAFWSTCWR